MKNSIKDLNKKSEIAIRVSGVSKTFRIPRLDSHKEMLVYARLAHNKVSSVRGAFVQKISSSFKKSSPLISPFTKWGQGGFPPFEKGKNSSSPFEKGGHFRIPLFKGGHFRIPLFKGGTQGGFSAGYEEFKALDNVSFEVKKGEFFGIIERKV